MKAISGEIQCAVASRTSSIMSKHTQISGPLMVILENYELPPKGFLGFYLGNHRFAVSIKHKINNFFSKENLIKTIEGDEQWFLYKDEISKTIEEFDPKQQKSAVLSIETLDLIQKKQMEILTKRHQMETELANGTYKEFVPTELPNISTILRKYHKDIILNFESCLTEEVLYAEYSSMFNKSLENSAKRRVESVKGDSGLLEFQQELELRHLKEVHDFEKYILIQQQSFLISNKVNSEKERLKFEELIFLERQKFEQNIFDIYNKSVEGDALTPELFKEKQRIDRELFYKRKNILENTKLSGQKKDFQIKLFACESLKIKRDFKEKVMQELGILKEIKSQNISPPLLQKEQNKKPKSTPTIVKPRTMSRLSALNFQSKKPRPQSVSPTMEEESDYSDHSSSTIISSDESDDWSTLVKTTKQKPSSQPPLSFVQRENLRRQQKQRSRSTPTSSRL